MEIFLVSLIFLTIGVLLVPLWLRRRGQLKSRPSVLPQTPEISKPSHQASPAPIPTPIPLAPSRSRFSQALASWKGLFAEGVKDRSRWEEALITADMGPALTQQLLAKLEASEAQPFDFFKGELAGLLQSAESSTTPWRSHQPWVLFVVGVNGVGKTTTIVKLAKFFRDVEKLRVAVVGADTFRKAAIDQLQRGAEKVGANFFSIAGSGEEVEGADPSAVIFDGLQKFKGDHDVILVDTSGRLHNKKNLMEELKKMKRVAQKVLPEAPHDVWMIVDSTLGQNAVAQGRAFHEALGLSGLVVTKLDGLSRGGTIFQLFQELKAPIRFLGVGERPEDLEAFKTDTFVEELFDRNALNS